VAGRWIGGKDGEVAVRVDLSVCDCGPVETAAAGGPSFRAGARIDGDQLVPIAPDVHVQPVAYGGHAQHLRKRSIPYQRAVRHVERAQPPGLPIADDQTIAADGGMLDAPRRF
jgi:hypothetical protein